MATNKLRSRKGLRTKSSLENIAESSFLRCPRGHSLPHKTDVGRCTPLSCVEASELPRLRPDKEDSVEARIGKVRDDEVSRTQIQNVRRTVWQDFLQIPVDLKGADAEKFADEQLVDMLPFAVGVLKKQLLFGSEDQQERAANKVMDANGRGKRELGGNTTPSIIINMTQGGVATAQTVDGQVVPTAAATPPGLPWRKPLPLASKPEVSNAQTATDPTDQK
jgi:hypothetical protein